MAIADALLGAVTGAAGVINEDAVKNRDFMRKQKAKIAESRLVRQEKTHDAAKAKYAAVQAYGTGERGQFMHAMKIFGNDKKLARKAVKDNMFADTLAGIKDPGEFVPYSIAVSDEEYRSIYGDESMAGKLMSKFGKVKGRRQSYRNDTSAGETEADAAMFKVAQGEYPDAGVAPAATDIADVEATLGGGELRNVLAESEEKSTFSQKADEITKQQGILDDESSSIKEISAAKAALEGLGVKPEGLGAVKEVLHGGKKVLANQDKQGNWVLDGKTLEPGSVTPLDAKPSSRMERINLLRKVNEKINATNDPVELAMLEDEKSVLLDTTTDAARRAADLRSQRELGIQDKLGAFEIAEYNVNTLAADITAEMGGPNAFIAKWTDNLDSYIAGIHGSSVTPQEIMSQYADVDGTPEEKAARFEKISTAYKTGSAEFIFETLKYSIANMLKEGQKLSTFDNKKVDDMFQGTWGTDQFAGRLNEATKMIAREKDRQVSNIMMGRGIKKTQIIKVTVDGVRQYWYPAPDGKHQQFIY
jgi:hypothetical protein